ncbi:hypothetical protein RI367_007880 [Sorochytrium milnesiophthora]
MVVPLSLPVVELQPYLVSPTSQEALEQCQKAAQALKTYGAVLIKDPRTSEGDNAKFLNIMEQYFDQPEEVKWEDVRKELGYVIGATPAFIEEPMCFTSPKCVEIVADLPDTDKPTKWAGSDPKWRFTHRIGPCPPTTKHAWLNAPPVVPRAFTDRWVNTMDHYGHKLHDAVEILSEMVAIGLGFDDPKVFAKLAKYGPHLLAPTGSDLDQYHQVDTVFAGFHYDVSFMTIHGKSRFPGLHIWARNTGAKMAVSVPDNCLIVQAGRELEVATGGAILAGYHEVIVSPATVAAYERAKAEGRSAWRVSSTLFFHLRSDVVLGPLGPYSTPESRADYPAMECGERVRQELERIKLVGEDQN